jgi:pimeloyl-ACP methyl ester carboxylesterase
MDETAIPVPLTDHLVLTAAAFGPHDGTPVISCHGTPGSRLHPPPDADVLHRLGVRLLCYDRPGYGGSVAQPHRTVADAAADIAAVADAFGVERFAVTGCWGGGPHALAAAALLPDRVTRCALVGSPAPLDAHGLDYFEGMSAGNAEELDAALAGRETLTAAIEPVARAASDDIHAFLAALRADLPEVDAHLLGRADVEQYLATAVAEGLRPGAQGWIDDDLAFCARWGFAVEAIDVPVGVWHGTEDTLVPVSHAGWLTNAIPRAEGRLTVGAGHLSLLDQLGDVYAWVLG